MKRKKSAGKSVLAVIIFTLILGSAGTNPCFAKNTKNDAVNKALAQGEKRVAVEKVGAEKPEVKKAKALAEDVKSFKRFQLSYESMWLRGKSQVNIESFLGGLNLKYRLRSRMDVYRAAFYFTPKTYLEGAYGVDYIAKNLPAQANLTILPIDVPLHVTGDNMKMRSVDLFQNIYTHPQWGTALDLSAGYVEYQEKVRLKYAGELTPGVTIDPIAAFNSRYTGYRFGLRFKGPFTMPDLPKNPFTLTITASYAPDLKLKGSGLITIPALIAANTDSKAKGYLLEAAAGLACNITPSLSLELLYNYMQIKENRGTYEDVANAEWTLKTILQGPSAKISYVF